MFGQHSKRNPWSMANDIAKEIGRRGFPAEAKPLAVMPAMGNAQKYAIIIPGRGLAVVNNDHNIVVASSNELARQAQTFEYDNAETAAENILRNLPLP